MSLAEDIEIDIAEYLYSYGHRPKHILMSRSTFESLAGYILLRQIDNASVYEFHDVKIKLDSNIEPGAYRLD